MRSYVDPRVVAAVLMAIASPSAWGQEENQQEERKAEVEQEEVKPEVEQEEVEPEVEEIVVVTGTRISGFDAPTPVTQVSQEQLQAKAVQRIAELLVDVPAFQSEQNLGQSSQPIGANNFDLRGLGPERTLLLLDGRRVAATDPGGGIDNNVIPTSLIKQVEIVTGGASAAYGSDAVSGVVNIALDHKFEGIKGDLQYGISTYDDVDTTAASLAMGRAFADGRLHVVGSLDYYDNNGQLNQSSRPWGRDNYALVVDPSVVPSDPNHPPTQVRAPNAHFSQLTAGGVSALRNIPALRGIQFGAGGEVLPFEYGSNVGTTWMIGGDGVSLADQANIFPQIERKSGFTRATFDVNDRLSIYADALYSNIDVFSNGTTATDRGTIQIRRDNAYLPKPVADIMAANNVQTFFMGRIGEEEGAFTNVVDNTVQRYGFGIEGKVGDNWRWDSVLQLSRNRYYREDGHNRNVRRYSLGVDAVINPATGTPICRALLNAPDSTDPDIASCVPINVFGPGSVNAAALNYIGGTAVLDSTQEQTLFGVNLQGTPFRMPAGDVSVAAGAEYRDDRIDATSDALSQQRGWITVNPQPLEGDVQVAEAYAEVVVPLLTDRPLVQSLDVNGAVRVTDYSTSGRVNTWKLGANYSPLDNLRFRGTFSRDIRAPSINELYAGQRQNFNTVLDPRDNSNPTVPQLTGGNPELTPETSKSWTTGVVYEPHWLHGLRMSVDYYSFDITDAIATLTVQEFINGCFVRQQIDLCDAIALGPDGEIESVSAVAINAAAASTSGFDTEIAYSLPMSLGTLDLRLLATYVEKLTTTINGVTSEDAGQIGPASAGGLPKWRVVSSVRLSADSFAVGVLARYIHSGVYSNDFVDGVDIDDNRIPSRTYVDLDFSHDLTSGFELYAKINNVFNVEPPLAPDAITSPNYNATAFHDRIGRYFKVGVRFEL